MYGQKEGIGSFKYEKRSTYGSYATAVLEMAFGILRPDRTDRRAIKELDLDC